MTIASLSLDLDNTWSYLKVHGSEEWKEYPSHFPTFIPIILNFLEEFDQKITFFVVGQDAKIVTNRKWLQGIVAAGHEVGNHSLHHEPWLQNENEEKVYQELKEAHEAIKNATGAHPVGFRGPGFCHSPSILNALQRLEYPFDASVLPTVLGPIAKLYYIWNMKKLPKEEMEKRKNLFGGLSNAFFPNTPFYWETKYGNLLELPVTTTPYFRFPFHLSYLIWLSQFSEAVAWGYLKANIALCKWSRVSPSILLHPPDFMGKEDLPGLSFFPGMNIPREKKIRFARRVFQELKRQFEVVPMSEHARRVRSELCRSLN